MMNYEHYHVGDIHNNYQPSTLQAQSRRTSFSQEKEKNSAFEAQGETLRR